MRVLFYCSFVLTIACGTSDQKGTKDAAMDAPEDSPIEAADDAADAGFDSGDVEAGGPACATAITVGVKHACALKSDGSLWCWGENFSGTVGDGTTTNRSLPVKIIASGVVEITAGDQHTCARKSDNSVWCWGNNAYSEVTADNDNQKRIVPTMVAAIGTTAAQVAAGYAVTCVRKLDSSVWCWGQNNHGQIGNGTTSNSIGSPTQVSDLGKTVSDVSVGLYHTCARDKNGATWCWGANENGALGDGTKIGSACAGDCRPSPTMSQMTGAVEISAGQGHTCARKSDGSIWCWGLNFAGAIGDGTIVDSASPKKLAAFGANAGSIVAGYGMSCATAVNGLLSCWGENNLGQVGDGTLVERHAPVTVLGLSNTTRVRSRGTVTCAIEGGSVWCWGFNDVGQLGNGMTGGSDFCMDQTKNCQTTPVQVKGLCP